MTTKITNDPVGITECYRHAPHWEGLMLGPVPFGSPPDQRTTLTIQVLFSQTLEAAIEDAWAYARNACAHFNHPFDPDEWDVVYMRLVNAN